MSKEVTKPESTPLMRITTASTVDELRMRLAQDPNHTCVNEYADNSEYIPISHIEADLDNVFGPLNWQVEDFQIQAIGGEVKGEKSFAYFLATLTLAVLSPTTGYWIRRSGTSSGKATGKQIETFSGKLKAEALKNAAKSLGVRFGRELNREHVARDQASKLDLISLKRDIKDELAGLSTIEEVKACHKDSPYRREQWFGALANARLLEIKKEDSANE